MSLAATLSSTAMRPASFLPVVKCSNCGEEIEIARMGEHDCSNARTAIKAAPMPPSANRPFAPSPLQKAPTPPPPPPPSPPQTRLRSPTVGSYVSTASKPTRLPPPPRINADAANRPYLAPIYPRSDSPASPALSFRSARSGSSSSASRPPTTRNATMPPPRVRATSPSPDLPASFDCAFPPFPTPPASNGSRPSTSNGRKTPTGSDRAPSRNGQRTERDPFGRQPFGPEPRSPRTTGGESVLKRADTLRSGPFDAARRKPKRNESSEPLPLFGGRSASPDTPMDGRRSRSQRPSRPERGCLTPTSLAPEFASEVPLTYSPSQPPVPLRSADRSRTMPFQSGGSGEPERPRLSRISSEPALRGRARASTVTAGSRPAALSPSESSEGTPRPLSRSASRIDHRIQDAPPVPLPAQQKRYNSNTNNNNNNKHRMHSPSDSGSSSSSASQPYSNGNSSEDPSPIGSAASSVDAFSPFAQHAASSSNPYGDEDRMKPAGFSTKLQQQRPGLRAEQPVTRSPPPNFARPRPSTAAPVTPPTPTSPALQSMAAAIMGSPVDVAWSDEQPGRGRSELQGSGHNNSYGNSNSNDQAMPAPLRINRSPAGGTRAQDTFSPPAFLSTPPADEYDPYRPSSSAMPTTRGRSKTSASQWGPPAPEGKLHRRTPPPSQQLPPLPTMMPPASTSTPPPPPPPPSSWLSSSSTTPPPRSEPHPTRPGPQRRTTSARPICRGCGEVIEGKSVKAADGRLTGRWHKGCFTCRTCAAPFATADFYVLADQPYCAHDYHAANGSLCHGCRRGIEGAYLETTSRSAVAAAAAAQAGGGGGGGGDRKFHPACFTCAECRIVLAEDYFEIAGRVFCERHALAAMRGQVRVGGVVAGAASGGGGVGGAGVGGGGGGGTYGGGLLYPPDRRGLMAERRTTKLMMM